ncbi:MAG: hypothetical protein IH625_17685 [Rhodobacteraceae bacterium]|nr:hypothetical protein [Paracoccaceae bacterium]
MRAPRAPLFLARAHYRRRRLHDAARFLPVVGVFLLLLPALWPDGSAGGSAVFAFVVWALMIVAAAVLAPGLARPETDDRAPPDEEG